MSQEITGRLEKANQFDIPGSITPGMITPGMIVLTYTRSDRAGAPLLSYKDADRELTFSGAEIVRADTPLGELVTVTLEEVIDAFVRGFTLLVPEIRLETDDHVTFDTIAVETTDRSGAFVPVPGPTGVMHTYRVHEFSGVARFVVP